MTGIDMKILIADDDEDSRIIMRVLLQSQGKTVVEAADGRECLMATRLHCPDAIILDLVMPRLDGWQVAAALRADPATRSIPILALTAAALPRDRECALMAGCDLVLRKPAPLAVLSAALDQLLSAVPATGVAAGAGDVA